MNQKPDTLQCAAPSAIFVGFVSLHELIRYIHHKPLSWLEANLANYGTPPCDEDTTFFTDVHPPKYDIIGLHDIFVKELITILRILGVEISRATQ